MTSHSHHTDRANCTDRAVAWLLKLQSKMLGDAYLYAMLPRDCHNITCTTSTTLSRRVRICAWLLRGEKVLIREI